MLLKVKKTSESAKLPTYGSNGAACFDIRANLSRDVIISRRSPKIISTSLVFEVPPGFVMLVFSRSGHGFMYDVRLANGTGIIDSDYRGELQIKLSADQEPFVVRDGDRIAQGMLVPIPKVIFQAVDELSPTERGSGGFGSTGIN